MDRVVRRHRTIPCEQGDPEVARSIYIKVEAELAGGRRHLPGRPAGQADRGAAAGRSGDPRQHPGPGAYSAHAGADGAVRAGGVGFGGWQGVRSLVALVVSFAVIVGFIVPAILRGHSPVPVALVGAMAIMLVSLYLSHGMGRKTTAAVVGTAVAGPLPPTPHRPPRHHRRPTVIEVSGEPRNRASTASTILG